LSRLSPYAPALILIAGYLLVLRAGVQRAVPLVGRITSVLPSVDGFTVRDLKASDEERRIAGMTNYVSRAYFRDTTVAFTTLVSYYDRQSRGKSIHSPRNCLPGAGWEVLSSGTQALSAKGGRYLVNRYLLKNGATEAVVYYWYQGRGRVVASEYAVRWNLLRDAAIRGHTEEALVRVVVPLRPTLGGSHATLGERVAQASLLGSEISKLLIPEVDRILPHEPRRI
jgi:EpsI family protein